MKIIKNHIFTNLAIILFATALLVTACVDAEHEGTPKTKEEVKEREEAKKLPEGSGAILLKFNDNARGTIVPIVPYSDLNFYVAISKDGSVIFHETGLKMTQAELENFPIALPAGDYSILVIAYYKENNDPAYKAEKLVPVSGGEVTKVLINLVGIAEGTDDCKLTYNIIPPTTLPTLAEMTITPLSGGTSGESRNFITTGYSSNPPVDLKPGYYKIAITYERDGYRTSTMIWVLHIYATLNTHFEEPLLPLVKNTLTVTFDTNGGDPGPAPVDAARGSTVSRPADPTHPESREFKGWLLGRVSTVKWNFDDVQLPAVPDRVWNDVTLFADWGDPIKVDIPPDVDFDTNIDPDDDGVYVFYIKNDGDHIHVGLPNNANNIQWYIATSSSGPYIALSERGHQFNITNIRFHNPFRYFDPPQAEYPIAYETVYFLKAEYTQPPHDPQNPTSFVFMIAYRNNL